MANLISQLGSVIQSWFSRQQTSQVRVFTSSVTEVYPDINQTTAITKGFNSNTAVYSIVRRAAKKFGSVPRYVEPIGQEGKSESEAIKGPLMDLLNKPNSEQGQDAFFSVLYAFYKVCGESFIWLNRGDTSELGNNDTLIQVSDEVHSRKPVLEMFVVPANRMIVVPDPENIFGVYGYILESSVRIPIRKVDIIHWKDINLNFDVVTKSHLRGWSGLASGYKTLEANNSATDMTVRMNQNGGAKKVLAEKSLTAGSNPVKESQLKKVFDTKINNADVKGAVTALQGDWSGIDLGMTSVDMELLKGKQLSMQELCFLMGVPYEFFDSQVTYANKQEAQKGWVINEIMPDSKQLDGELSRVLCKAFGMEKTATICSDFDDMPELQEDKKAQIEWLMKGPFTINEIREATGYEESTEELADEIFIPSGYAPLSDLAGDGGEEIIQSLYNANGRANTSNGNGKISQNGKGAKV